MILGECARIKNKTGISLTTTLWILKDTIIEPHYTQRGNQQLLVNEMKESWMEYGIWIDEITGMEFDLKEFPHEWKKIWDGEVEIKENNQ
jgi:cyanophycinase-like exopeptidase